MTRNKTQLINKTKKHIASLGYLYYMVPDAGSLMLLKENDYHHYLMIIFTGRNRTWEQERRHFSIAELEVDTFNDVEEGVAKYLSNGHL